MNISSIIIRAKTQNWQNLLEKINKIAYTEVALEDSQKGIIIATIQAPDTGKDIASLKEISQLKGVLSADMHLTYSEEEFKGCEINMNEVAELIDTTPVEEMKYNGDVNNLMKE
ncbi:chaperone NapD [Helicobacter himalayensis]|uniref:chaperone NapD n=1 Tax=Helicobacter himalayensis TaxID=1591088 RepID=UPI000833CF58|nr:chaperone NapD [Helicobacter himalayensis]